MQAKFKFGTIVQAYAFNKDIIGEIVSVTFNNNGEIRYKINCANTVDKHEFVIEEDIVYRLSKVPVNEKQTGSKK